MEASVPVSLKIICLITLIKHMNVTNTLNTTKKPFKFTNVLVEDKKFLSIVAQT